MERVLVIGMTDNPGGIESVIMSYYRVIDKTQMQFDFLVNTPIIAYEDEIAASGGRVFHVPARHKSLSAFYRALTTFFEQHADEFHVIWLNANSLANISYLAFAKRYHIPKRIIHCHNGGEKALRNVLHTLNRQRVRRYATDYWSCSDDASEWFYGKDFKQLPSYRWIPNAIDMSTFRFDPDTRYSTRESLKLTAENFLIGHVGRFYPQKNHMGLIQIFDELHRINPAYRLLLVGQGPLEDKVRQEVRRLGLETSVIFAGLRKDIPALYQAMDLFLFPSLYEGLSVALIEAQANGVPVAVSTRNSRKNIVNHNVLMIDVQDSASDNAFKIDQWLSTDSGRREDTPEILRSVFSIGTLSNEFQDWIR